jgi:TatD DNase family protein
VIDSHCHLDLPVFDVDRPAVLARAAALEAILVPAVRPATWDRLRAVVATDSRLWVAYGAHPQIVPDLTEDEWRALSDGRLAAALGQGAVAVGECGLDGRTGDHPAQERALALQIAVARELRLPLVVHVLGAHGAAPRLLREAKAHEVGGVMHSYSGSPELVPIYRDLGFAFSFAGPVTYANARKPLAAARAVPDELLLAETDAPDQTPVPHRGSRCEPAHVRHVVAALAATRGATMDETARLVTANARRLFRAT